ncbi:MAG: glycoside hydrolase family 16 protein, partial [Luminiphilus sp.]|nr:glycoside hydrolase family 16 protein [Luminiphilus sp.]
MFDRLYRHGRVAGIFLAAALLNACGGGSATAPDTEPFYLEPESEWALVWADEFDGAAVDSSNWTFQLGDGSDNGLPGWGNYERQYYQAENASIAEVDDTSALVIEARAESAGSSEYTSARMRSLEKFDFKFGRVEIRAKAAPGDGMWSAVWMMPTDSTYGTWAAGGEIDIMEVVNAGTENQRVFMAAHYGFEWPLNQITSEGAEVDDASDWHTYALEWSGDYLRWFVDGEHLRTVNKDVYYSYYFKDNTDGYQLASDPAAPFDGEFHLLVNLAVGGVGPGVELDPESVPGEMVVDYIRVYQCQYGAEGGVGCNTFADRSLESPEAQSPEVVTTDIYTDAVGPLTWSFLTGDVTRDLQAGVGYNNDGAIDIAVSEVAVEGRGNVLDVITSGGGNVVINAADGKTFDVYGHRGGGELKFDMYIDSSMTAPSSTIAIKMDSGYPALGSVSIDVAAMPKNEWFT